MTSYKLNFKKFSGGEIIRTYSNNEYGYVIIESDEIIYDSVLTDLHLNFINADTSTLPKREAILRARTVLLKQFVEEYNGKEIPGRVTVIECLEDEIPIEIQKQFLRDDIPIDQAILPFVKTFKYTTNLCNDKNEEKLILKNNNKRILQFVMYSLKNEEDRYISEYDLDVLQKIISQFPESKLKIKSYADKKLESLKSLLVTFKNKKDIKLIINDDFNLSLDHIVYDVIVDQHVEIITLIDNLSFSNEIIYTINYAINDSKYSRYNRFLLSRVFFILCNKSLEQNEDIIIEFSKSYYYIILIWIEEVEDDRVNEHINRSRLLSQFGWEIPSTMDETKKYHKKIFSSFEHYIHTLDKIHYLDFCNALQLFVTNNIKKLKVNTFF